MQTNELEQLTGVAKMFLYSRRKLLPSCFMTLANKDDLYINEHPFDSSKSHAFPCLVHLSVSRSQCYAHRSVRVIPEDGLWRLDSCEPRSLCPNPDVALMAT